MPAAHKVTPKACRSWSLTDADWRQQKLLAFAGGAPAAVTSSLFLAPDTSIPTCLYRPEGASRLIYCLAAWVLVLSELERRTAMETRGTIFHHDTDEAATAMQLLLQEKPAEEYHRSRSYKDGLFGQCRACCAAAAAKRAKPLVAAPTVPAKSCSRCGETKPASDFNINKTTSSGLTSHCKVQMLSILPRFDVLLHRVD